MGVMQATLSAHIVNPHRSPIIMAPDVTMFPYGQPNWKEEGSYLGLTWTNCELLAISTYYIGPT